MRRKRRQHSGGTRDVVVRHWAAPFVLAMLVLRSMVPAGFMLAPVNGGLAVVLCDADATAAMYGRSVHDMSAAAQGTLAPDMSAGVMAGGAHDMAAATAANGADRAHDMSGHDMSGHDMSGHHMSAHDMSGHPGGHTHPDPTCPFAQSSGPSPLAFFAPITAAISPSTPALPDFTARTHAHFGPTRQQSPRGPPRLA